MLNASQNLMARLFAIEAVKFGAFKLKLHEKHPDAPLSPIFLNLRSSLNPKPGLLGSEEFQAAADLMVELAQSNDIKFDCIAGIPHAGDPFADAFVAAWPSPIPIVRLQKHTSDSGRRIGGAAGGENQVRSKRVLLLDDLITKADSKLEAIQSVRDDGGIVTDVIVLVDREQGGAVELQEAGCSLHSVYKLSAMLDFYVEHGCITPEKRDEVREYIASN